MQWFLQEWDLYTKSADQIDITTAKYEEDTDAVIKTSEILTYEEEVKNTSAQFMTVIKILQLTDEDIQRKKFESQLTNWESVIFRLKSRIENMNQLENIESIQEIEQMMKNIQQQQQTGSVSSTEEIGFRISDCEEQIEKLNKLLESLKSVKTKKDSEELETFSALHHDIKSMLRSAERDLDDLKILKEILIESEKELRKLNWETKKVQHQLHQLRVLETKISRNAILVSLLFLLSPIEQWFST